MAEDDWTKKRKRSENSSSSDDSSQYSSACEGSEGGGRPAKKTGVHVFDITSLHCTESSSKADGSLTDGSPPPSKPNKPAMVGLRSAALASGSGLGKRKSLRDAVTRGVKRRLWDVDAEQVDIDLDRELKRMHKEVTLEKSEKWNFDFEKEAPLSGHWSWCSTETAPHFYKTKDVTSKFKPRQPPTFATLRLAPRVPNTSPPSAGGKLIRPKPIRPTTSKPATIQITFANRKESSSSASNRSQTADSASAADPRLSTRFSTAVADPSAATPTSADSESGTISSSSTASSCSVIKDSKRRKPMTLRPRKRKRLQRKKS